MGLVVWVAVGGTKQKWWTAKMRPTFHSSSHSTVIDMTEPRKKGPFEIAFASRQPGEEVPPPPPELVEWSRNSTLATLGGIAYGVLTRY